MVNPTEILYLHISPDLEIWRSAMDLNLYLHLPAPITSEQENELVKYEFFITRRSLEPTNEGSESDYVYTLSHGKQAD